MKPLLWFDEKGWWSESISNPDDKIATDLDNRTATYAQTWTHMD